MSKSRLIFAYLKQTDRLAALATPSTGIRMGQPCMPAGPWHSNVCLADAGFAEGALLSAQKKHLLCAAPQHTPCLADDCTAVAPLLSPTSELK